jgi:hypothetical protein
VTLLRLVAEETLDRLAPDDPQAMRSRRDLVRVHRAMRTRSIVAQAWQELVAPGPSQAPLRILEIGAGDGSLLLGVARALAPRWPPVQLTLLDRQDIVSAATRAGYAELGWAVQVQRVDVLVWAEQPGAAVSGPALAPWDLITATLFLHHFGRSQLELLLAAVASRSQRFFACEPKRSWLPLAGSHLVGAIGAGAVTREDAVLSVHAGFRGDELSALWPRVGGAWQTRESGAGLFSHCFSARRAGIE